MKLPLPVSERGKHGEDYSQDAYLIWRQAPVMKHRRFRGQPQLSPLFKFRQQPLHPPLSFSISTPAGITLTIFAFLEIVVTTY